MPIVPYACRACGKQAERVEITTADKAAPPPVCDGVQITEMVPGVSRSGVVPGHAPERMERAIGASSFADVTAGGFWCRFSSSKGPVEKNRGPRGI